jgi:hypothetical protein
MWDECDREDSVNGIYKSAKDLRLVAAGAKLEEGNILAATRILCSQDYKAYLNYIQLIVYFGSIHGHFQIKHKCLFTVGQLVESTSR